MAKLVDAPHSKCGGLTVMRVRVSLCPLSVEHAEEWFVGEGAIAFYTGLLS